MYRIFCLRDLKAVEERNKGFLRPFIAVHDGEAMRGIIANLRDPKHPIAQFAQDYDLYRVAEFDEHSGEFMTFSNPVFICTVLSLVEAPPQGAGPVNG